MQSITFSCLEQCDFLAVRHDQAAFSLKLLGELTVKWGFRRQVVWDAVTGAHKRGAFGRGSGVHIVPAVAGKEGVVKLPFGQCRHLRGLVSVARDVKLYSVAEGEDKADAFGRIVIGVARLSGLCLLTESAILYGFREPTCQCERIPH